MKEVMNIISTDLFRSIVNSKSLKISQLNSVISLLIKQGISFNLLFTPATRTDEAEATLTIYIRPNVSIQVSIAFDSGEMFL